tara:strand:- start:6201 stop:7451 length:1251 start_codon:yes stop_codon:yes gene_type:complete
VARQHRFNFDSQIMPDFQYIAIDQTGNRQTGTLQADSVEAAQRELKEGRGWTLLELKEQKQNSTDDKMSRGASEDLAAQLAELTASQLPLEQGLRKLADELAVFSTWGRKRQREQLNTLASRLESGQSLDDALQVQGAPADLIAAIRAGLVTGKTGQAMSQYVTYVKDLSTLRSRVSISFIYPAFLFSLAMALFFGLLIYLGPLILNFSDIFYGFGMQLPLITSSLLETTKFIFDFGAIIFFTGLAGVVLFCVLCFVLPRQAVRRMQLSIPIFGSILQSISMSRFTHALGFLTDNDVPLAEALRLAGQSADDSVVAEASQRWAARLEAGESLRDAADRIRGIPADLIESLHWNSDREILSRALHALGEMYESRARLQAVTITAFTEPVIVIFVGVLFMWIVIALFFPLIQLMNDLS